MFCEDKSSSGATAYTLTTSETIPDNITLVCDRNVEWDGAGTLTINGRFVCGRHKVFGSSITVVFGNGAVDEIYPEWWGGNPDPGTTDMTVEIQAAIDCAEASTSPPPVSLTGTYLTSSTLTIDSGNVYLIGTGGNRSTWIKNSHATQNIIDFTSALNFGGLKNLTITKTVVASSGYAVDINDANYVTLENVEIYGDSKVYNGIRIYQSYYTNITQDCFISGVVNRGIYIYGTSGNVSSECWIHCPIFSVGEDAINIGDYAEGIYLQSVDIYDATGFGIRIEGTGVVTYHIFIYDCVVDSCTLDGIYIEYALRVKICNTWVASNRMGVVVQANANRILIEGGFNVTNKQYGIALDGDDIKVTGVMIENASDTNSDTYDAILINDDCDGISIIGNTIIDPGSETRWGINCDASATNVLIESNRIEAMQTGTLNLPTSAVARNNHISDSTDVASAATVTLPDSGSYFNITGTTGITSVTASFAGRVVHLKFAASLTVTDGSNLKLAGNFSATADDVLSLVCDATNWHEISRSAN